MSKKRVWFNQGLSQVYDAIRIIHVADRAGELSLLASHSKPQSPALAAADESWIEPAKLSDDEYIDWCLACCRERRVDLFVPGRRREVVAGRQASFEAAGVKVLVVATPDVFELLERKDRFYADLAASGLEVPEYHLVRTLTEFDAAYADLAGRHRYVCVKPVVSVFGVGFHILDEQSNDYERLVAGSGIRVSAAAFRRALAETDQPRLLMLMEYLPGPEHSVDCVAMSGQLATAVARRKHGSYQVLANSGPAVEVARQLTERYRLSGIFNVQTRDARSEPLPLEINTRMSGGMLYACLSGVALPYWSVMLALGLRTKDDIPKPRAGVIVAPVTAAIAVGNIDNPAFATAAENGAPELDPLAAKESRASVGLADRAAVEHPRT